VTTQQQTQARRDAAELILHRLTNTQPGAIYEEIIRLANGGGISPVMNLTIHLADAMAAVLIKDTGSRDAAIAALREQLAKADTTPA